MKIKQAQESHDGTGVFMIFFPHWSFVLWEGRAVIAIRSGAFWERQQGRHFCSAGLDTSP